MTSNYVPKHATTIAALRWAIVIVFALFGTAKFAAYEAEGVAKIASHYPLFGWMYPIWGERGASNVIGSIELLTGAIIAIGALSPRASFIGGSMGVFTFCVTLSFSLGAPSFWQAGYGAPFLGSTGQFLMKDVVLLAACFALAVDGLRRMQRVQ